MAGEVIGNFLTGLLGNMTRPNNTTAQYTGGFSPGTNGMVDPGVNNNQPVGPSWSPINISNSQQNWNQLFNPQMQQAIQAQNIAMQGSQMNNALETARQNNVQPGSLGALYNPMQDQALSRLQGQTLGNQAGSLQSLLSGAVTQGQLPYGQAMGSSTAGNTIANNMSGMALANNSTAQAQAAAPFQSSLGRILSQYQMAQGQAGTQGANNQGIQQAQQAQYYASNPGAIPGDIQTRSLMEGNQADAAGRQSIFNGGSVMNFGRNNPNIPNNGSPTGVTSINPPQYNMPGMPMKAVQQPVYTPMGVKGITPVLNPQGSQGGLQPWMTTPPPAQSTVTPQMPTSNAGMAPGGVNPGASPQPQDIIKQIQTNPALQQQLIKALGIKPGMPQQQNQAGSLLDRLFGNSQDWKGALQQRTHKQMAHDRGDTTAEIQATTN